MIVFRRLPNLSATAFALIFLVATSGVAAACTAQDFAQAVDDAGERLRAYSAKATPALKAKLEQLRLAKKWPKPGHEDRGLKAVHDKTIAQYDEQVGDHLVNIDELGREGDAPSPECAKLSQLESASAEMLAVMKAKTEYTLAKLDRLIKPKVSADAPAQASKPAAANNGRSDERDDYLAQQGWQAKTRPAAEAHTSAGQPDVTANLDVRQGPPRPMLPPDAFSEPEDAYTIEEIRDATRGFFGTISTNLATVIEHAFTNFGKPTAYVLGKEGGGAFLAGLRYGNGTLFMRAGGKRKVYWTGPSLGYDFGAEGSRTMFLIYNLNDHKKLFRRYTGVNGSAFLVGGVGVTLLKGGPVILAPIRSGIGLRLGANIGYIRFTPQATWNPF